MRMMAPSTPSFLACCQSICPCHSDTSITPLACCTNNVPSASKNAGVPLYVPQWAPYELFCRAAGRTMAPAVPSSAASRCVSATSPSSSVSAASSDSTSVTASPIASLTSATSTGMNDSPSVLASGSAGLSTVPTSCGSVTVSPVSRSITSPSSVTASSSETTVASSGISSLTVCGRSLVGLSGIDSASSADGWFCREDDSSVDIGVIAEVPVEAPVVPSRFVSVSAYAGIPATEQTNAVDTATANSLAKRGATIRSPSQQHRLPSSNLSGIDSIPYPPYAPVTARVCANR